jgi:predicted RNA-binding Zn ribbon-like protein
MSSDPHLLGEPLAIELANTLIAGDVDLLVSPAEWIEAHRDELPEGAIAALEPLRRLRAAVRELLYAAMADRTPDRAALAHVNAVSGAAAARRVLEWDERGPRAVEATAGADVAEATLAAIARSAIDVLAGPDRGRLRRCEGPDCVLLFVATHPRRRWCSPEACGNRVRVARHYARHRADGRNTRL